ncbi:hypothetical protein ACFE04_017460 [Oxalis oulophora]
MAIAPPPPPPPPPCSYGTKPLNSISTPGENGTYVPLHPLKLNHDENLDSAGNNVFADDPLQDHSPLDCSSSQMDHATQPHVCAPIVHAASHLGHSNCNIREESPKNPPPPSEWLEDTLIELYLSGYNQGPHTIDDTPLSLETDDRDALNFTTNENSDSHEEELEEGEWIPEGYDGLVDSRESPFYQDTIQDEENWLAQYGQVIESSEEPVLEFPVVELWDWKLVTSLRKNGKGEVTRLVGRLVKKHAKLHPSLPSRGSLLKTAPICEVRLDLVRVATGQVYKLRSPSKKYLVSVPAYDSSNPTKNWVFPELSSDRHKSQSKIGEKIKLKATDEGPDCKDLSMLPHEAVVSVQQKSCTYRDRAAERRSFHSFGVVPGQGTVDDDDFCGQSSASTEEAAVEALNMSFGSGSYARRMLENMGWKQGEGIGKTTKGMVEPIQSLGNIGNAGLGWNQRKRNR